MMSTWLLLLSSADDNEDESFIIACIELSLNHKVTSEHKLAYPECLDHAGKVEYCTVLYLNEQNY